MIHNGTPAIGPLARAIERRIRRTGDYETALPALSLHRRDAQTEPMPCVYPLSLIVTTQGDKRVTFGDKVLDHVPGQSMLTTIDLPVISHVTRASTQRPYLGLLLRLDARAVALAAAELPCRSPIATAPMRRSRLRNSIRRCSMPWSASSIFSTIRFFSPSSRRWPRQT